MINVKQLLGFKDVFPEDQEEPIINYLRNASRESLLKSIGFFNTKPLPNYDNFFSNPEVNDQIVGKVNYYLFHNQINVKPAVVSGQGALKFAEVVLSNSLELLENNTNYSLDDDEMNLFKAFLCINTELISNQVLDNLNEDNFEKLVDFSIIFTFPFADLAFSENDDLEFLHLLYATFYKVEALLAFLNSKPEYSSLKDGFIKSFNVSTEEEFVKQMTYLFGKLLELKGTNSYLWNVEDKDALAFLDSMVSYDIAPDEDFTHIKNSPIYKVEESVYSIIHYFFVIDKFYKSAKFKLKELYEKDEALKTLYGNFFSFFNSKFSENFLMKNLLDEMFSKKHYVKKPEREKELPGEPDYYLRHNNEVFIFENKDVLVAKGSKASADIEQINAVLKKKFLVDGTKKVGIGQIVTTIGEIGSKHFRFDDYVNSKTSLTIYPILLVHDRIFQTLGINYRLNQWFKEQCIERLGDLNKTYNIKSLTVIDIDTLILWLPYFQVKDKNFKEVLNFHMAKMNKKKKVNNAPNQAALFYRANQNLTEQLSPISRRNIPYNIDLKKLMNRFKIVIKDE
ncbi:hypothetical protein [Flavobacterium hiemivividum]|uniref:Uncharacterized protein n=1 Tax=Flavobacterium hiemivividum TaxID=2541734 RepID=A0A4R5CL06_9FLAO|nr:hypothetical protein [Flavobacterium hiemivividum]TDE01002.1 hypothetical protein E0F98_15550 [Flavobacterium hiemivividum]